MSSGQSAPANAVKRLPWEIAEMVGAGLLGAAGTIAVLSIVSGVAYAFTNTTQPTSPFGNAVQVGPTIAEVTQRSTLWATPVMALLVIGAIGVAWWQVESWSSFVAEDEEATDDEMTSAFRHLLRAKVLVTSALAAAAVVAAAVVALVVSTIVVFLGGPGNIVVSEDLSVIGQGLGTLAVVGVGAFAWTRLRSSVEATFTAAETDEAEAADPGC